MHDQSFCQYGFISWFYHVLMCTCLLSAFVPGKEALCYPCLYEYRRYDLYVDGELVSFTVLCCSWYDMRSNLVEDCSERNPKQIIASWTVASLLYNGVNLLPIWFFWETYYSFAKSSGMDQSYIDSYISYYKTPGRTGSGSVLSRAIGKKDKETVFLWLHFFEMRNV